MAGGPFGQGIFACLRSRVGGARLQSRKRSSGSVSGSDMVCAAAGPRQPRFIRSPASSPACTGEPLPQRNAEAGQNATAVEGVVFVKQGGTIGRGVNAAGTRFRLVMPDGAIDVG